MSGIREHLSHRSIVPIRNAVVLIGIWREGKREEGRKGGEAMKAAIYSRVSTEDQEKEGTSLESQRQACLAKAVAEGYQVPQELIFVETYSGLSLERPELTKLRAIARDDPMAAVIAYSPDRLCRNGEDILTLAKEFKAHGAKLIFVKEKWDDTLNGKLIAFILGWASEFEAAQIRERTMRGKRARALQGRLPSGTGRRLFGYDYLPGKGIGEGVRYENKEESKWVKEMYRWLVEEGVTINGITRRLRDLGVPTPAGSAFWRRQTIYRILTNPAYVGKTYSFTRDYIEPKRRRSANSRRKKTGVVWKPKEEWIEVPNATPAIIDQELFETAQAMLKRNKELSTRNAKRQYLLSGYIFCHCGARYQGYLKKWKDNGKTNSQRYYRCGKSQSIASPERCLNRQLHAPRTEEAVWREIETTLAKPETVLKALEIQAKEAKQTEALHDRLSQIDTLLENRAKQKERIWRAFELTGDEDKFKRDIEVLTREVKALESEELELQHRIESYRQYEIDAERIKEACQLFSANLNDLTYEEKRFALEALQIRVLVDGEKLRLEGIIPIGEKTIVSSAQNRPCLQDTP
jgi:site-specific DNA recombinase